MCAYPAAQSPQDIVAALTKRIEELEARVAALEKASTPRTQTQTSSGWQRLRAGMTVKEVMSVLGKPRQRSSVSCLAPPLIVGDPPVPGQCQKWTMADGGVVEFEHPSDDPVEEVLARWKPPGAGAFIKR
jgi:hypothetical protein